MRKTVLVVEDDADARAIFCEAIEQRGYRVLAGVHGAEGVHLARRHRPDLILMDIRMPVMDGDLAVRYLKSDPMISRTPVWGISAYLIEGQIDEPPKPLGFDRLIAKPANPQQVAAEIEDEIGPA